MKTSPIRNERGLVFAFEIENLYIGIRAMADLLATVSGVSDIHVRRLFSKEPSERHIAFSYKGEKFVVWEPYGDSSVYWIGPESDNPPDVDVADLEHAFKEYKLGLISRALGGR